MEFKCNLCMQNLDLSSLWSSSSTTPTAYLSECLRHIFCADCKNRIYPKCVCRPQSRYMPINDRMPEKYRSMFRPVKDILNSWQRVDRFQQRQNQLVFQLMCRHIHRANELIEQIDEQDDVRENQFNQHYLQRCKQLHYLLCERKQRQQRQQEQQ